MGDSDYPDTVGFHQVEQAKWESPGFQAAATRALRPSDYRILQDSISAFLHTVDEVSAQPDNLLFVAAR